MRTMDAESFPPFGSSAFRPVQALPSTIKLDLLWHLFSFTPPQQARHVVSDGNLFLLQPPEMPKGE